MKHSKSLLICFICITLSYCSKSGGSSPVTPVTPIVVPSITINNVTQARDTSGSPTNFTFAVILSASTTDTVKVNYTTVDSSAFAATDYTAVSGTLVFNPGNTVVLIETLSDWRKCMYYYPGYETYFFEYYNSSLGATLLSDHYKDHEINTYVGQSMEIHLNSSTNIVWIGDSNSDFFRQLQSKIEIKTIILPDGFVVYYSDLKNITNFTVDNITFIKD